MEQRGYDVGPAATAADSLRLHLNEYQLPHAPAVREALADCGTFFNPEAVKIYPGGAHTKLAAQITEVFALKSPAQVIPTAGSDEFLRAVVEAFAARREAREVVLFQPTYTHFLQYVRAVGLQTVTCTFLDATWEDGKPAAAQQLAAAVATLESYSHLLAAGCLVYLVNPNNPAGAGFWSSAEGRSELLRLSNHYPNSWFLLDEAYVEYLAAEDAEHAGHWMSHTSYAAYTNFVPNLLVSKTFSKAFGLAGLRVGYGVVHARLRPLVAPYVNPKSLQPFSAHVAAAALRSADFYLKQARATVARRRQWADYFRSCGWLVVEGDGNFLLVYAAGATDELVAQLAAENIYVRNRSELPDLAGFFRVTVGSGEAMARLARALEKSLPMFNLHYPNNLFAKPQYLLHTPKRLVAALRSLYWKVASILQRTTIFWPEAGTLLGVVRHGGIIPWDNDLDFGYLHPAGEDDPLPALRAAFVAHNLQLRRNRTDAYWQVFDRPTPAGHVVCADLFPYRRREEGGSSVYRCADPRYAASDPASPNADCNTVYLVEPTGGDELLPLKAARFYGALVHIPRKADAALARALGADFMTRAKVRVSATENAGEGGAAPVHRYTYVTADLALTPPCLPA